MIRIHVRTLLFLLLALLLSTSDPLDAITGPKPKKTSLFPVRQERASVAVDPSGALHVAFQSPKVRMRHAWRQNGRWKQQEVDASDSGWDNCMAVDSSGRVHVAYHAERVNPVRAVLAYAVFDSAGMTVTDIDDGGYGCDLKIDSDDRPRIIYYGLGGAIRYAEQEASGWGVEEVGANGLDSFPISLAIDSSGAAHVTFTHRIVRDVVHLIDIATYATNASGSWTATDLLEQEGGTLAASLAVDRQDRPHVAVTVDQTVRYLHFDGAAWQSEDVFQDPDVTQYPDSVALGLDSQDRPHMLFSTYVVAPKGDRGVEATLYAFRDGTVWFGALIDRGNAGFDLDIALDADDNVHGVYQKALTEKRSTLRYVRIPAPN